MIVKSFRNIQLAVMQFLRIHHLYLAEPNGQLAGLSELGL